MDRTRLEPHSRDLLGRQLLAPTWSLDSEGGRVVEAKAETKRRIGRSPDDADALNLACATVLRLETGRWENPLIASPPCTEDCFWVGGVQVLREELFG